MQSLILLIDNTDITVFKRKDDPASNFHNTEEIIVRKSGKKEL